MSCKTLAQDITQAISTTTLAGSDQFVFARNSQAYNITFSSFTAAIGTTGCIKSQGSPTSVSILNQPAQGYNYIRGIEPSQGITAAISPQGGVSIKTNFANDTTGKALIQDVTSAQIKFKSIVGGVNTTVVDNGTFLTVDVESASPFSSQVVVRDASDFDSPIDSTVQYLIDGVVDMGATELAVPSGGINLAGYNFNVSKLISSSAAYTMFTGANAGSFVAKGLTFEASGAGSRVFGVTSATGGGAIEISNCNFIDCTSLGTITSYRQYFETGTGRFGGSPSLTFAGAWAGGVRISESIIRSLSSGMTGSLFAAGAGLAFGSRFVTNVNCDLPASAPLIDFSASNFTNNTTLQINGSIITRDGVSAINDTNVSPNIDHTDDKSLWQNNVGIRNTNPGGLISITSAAATTLVLNTYASVAGTYALANNQHFTAPSNGQLRHDVAVPRDFSINCNAECSGTANDLIRLRVMKYDDSAAASSEVISQLRRINSSSGGANTAQFSMFTTSDADELDYFYLEARNETASNNATFSVDTALAASV